MAPLEFQTDGRSAAVECAMIAAKMAARDAIRTVECNKPAGIFPIVTRTSVENQSPASTGGVRIVQVGAERDGQRIDNFLAGQLKGVPKSLIYRTCPVRRMR